MSVEECKIVELSSLQDTRGHLTYVENQHLPFEIKRVYYLHGIPKYEIRGEHGHIKLQQLIIPLNGSFEIILNDGFNKKSFKLDSPQKGVYICPLIWRKLFNFSSNAICLVLASEQYDESDYFRNYSDFLEYVRVK
jgi:hypothetical protein